MEVSNAPSVQQYVCVRCQTRKVKCDRLTPQCSKCVKRNVQCEYKAPAPPNRGKRKRAEADLQFKLQHYETLLKENGVKLQEDASLSFGTLERSPATSLQTQAEARKEPVLSDDQHPEAVRLQSANTFIKDPVPHMGNALWQDLIELREKDDMSSDDEEDPPHIHKPIDDGTEIVLGVDSEVSCDSLEHYHKEMPPSRKVA